jgi:protein-disulfide isomerase
MNKIRLISFLLASFFLSWITFSTFTISTVNAASIEEEVLQIIRNNPDVVLESIQKYIEEQKEKQAQMQQTLLQEIKTNPIPVIGDSPVTGASSKEVILLEFSDFQCPYCNKFNSTLNQFMAQHQDEITLVYKYFPLTNIHSQAIPAAKAAWAALQQGKFWEYQDSLFQQQNQLGEELYLEIAENLELDLEQFNYDRQSSKAESAINKDVELANKIGIASTPSFIFNGNLFSGAVSLSELESIFSKLK